MKILVTGGAGFIGSHIVDRYVAQGHQVVVIDNLTAGRREFVNAGAKFYHMDVRSPDLVHVLEAERPEVANHHAAQIDVRRSVEDPGFDASVNILGSLNLLKCCRQAGVRRVIFASTGGAVYGDTAVLPTPEDHPTRPASPYGIAKLAAEHYLLCLGGLSGIPAVALRYANVYGPRQNPLGEAGVVAIFTHRLLRGEPANINGDGAQTRDYVYVGDVVEANCRALDQPEVTGILNIGTGVETSVLELFRRLRALLGSSAEERHGPPKPGEQLRSVLDASLAARALGWKPQVTLEEGLRRTVEYMKTRDSL